MASQPESRSSARYRLTCSKRLLWFACLSNMYPGSLKLLPTAFHRAASQPESSARYRLTCSKRLLWVACFGDVQQRINPVTGCPRVSLVYALHRPDHAQAAGGSAGSHSLLRRCQV